MIHQEMRCPRCDRPKPSVHSKYTLQGGEQRLLYRCPDCRCYFPETFGTACAGVRTPLSRIQQIFDALNDGLGVNAACRTFHVSKNTLADWQARLTPVKAALLLYALCHQFVQPVIEGDELYTQVNQTVPPAASTGWTVVLMERASRFIWELSCGERERSLFEQAMQTLADVITQTGDVTRLTDGERRYSLLLFEICRTTVRTGQRGRPRQSLPKGVRVRMKNKGAQAHQRGRKRSKSEAPLPEHPDTHTAIPPHDIHANHLEGFNASLRRRLAAYRRKANTDAKKRAAARSA